MGASDKAVCIEETGALCRTVAIHEPWTEVDASGGEGGKSLRDRQAPKISERFLYNFPPHVHFALLEEATLHCTTTLE